MPPQGRDQASGRALSAPGPRAAKDIRLMVPQTGQRVGPYEILETLGAGGMGLVFRAWDGRLHREVALKLLRYESETPRMRERFLLEARAASALNHPHICTVFDMGEQDGEPYLVMELLQGLTLKEKMAAEVLTAEEIVRYGMEVADALAAAHAKGIIHRDVKPANVFLINMARGFPQAKVLDFGLAKVVSQASENGRLSRRIDLTSEGSTVGTLAYMSPEQALGEPLDVRSDLFSLGVVMYEMATRRVPFRGTTSALIYVQLLHHAPQPMGRWNDAIPRELEQIVMRLLRKGRRERFQTAAELRDALRKLAERRDGDWLKKFPRARVPLVEAMDPVVRGKGPGSGVRAARVEVAAKQGSGLRRVAVAADPQPGAEQREPGVTSAQVERSDESDHIRPQRLPKPESGSRKSAFNAGESAVATVTATGERRSSGQIAVAARVATRSSGVTPTPPARMHSAARAGSGPERRLIEAGAVAQLHRGLEAAPVQDLRQTEPKPALASEQENRRGSVVEAPRFRPVRRQSSAQEWWWMALVGIGIALMLALLLTRGEGVRRVDLRSTDAALLTVIQNKTGDPAMDGVVERALEIGLEDSPRILLRGEEAYAAEMRAMRPDTEVGNGGVAVTPRRVAQSLGAKMYVYGEVGRTSRGWIITVDVLDAESNDKLLSLQEMAKGKQDVSVAATRLAVRLREELGENLGHENGPHAAPPSDVRLPALQAFAEGEKDREEGRTAEALRAYDRAAAEDPGFALASMRRAWLLAEKFSEVDAAQAATAAQLAAARAGVRVQLLTEAYAEMLAEEDDRRALETIRRLLAIYPRDRDALIAQARAMRLDGHLTEALLSAEQARAREPLDWEAYDEAEKALIGLGRPDEVQRMEAQAERAGVRPGRNRAMATALLSAENSEPVREAGSAPSAGVSVGESAGARAFLSASEALDAALRNNCGLSRELRDAPIDGEVPGNEARFRAGLASALCGDPVRAADALAHLTKEARRHSRTAEISVPMLRAGIALAGHDATVALAALSEIPDRDRPPLATYLRGLAHRAGHQEALADADFRQAAEGQGRALLVHETLPRQVR